MAEICPACNQALPKPEAVKVPGHKPGYLTTEFWVTALTVLAMGLEAFQGALPPQTAAVVTAIVAGLYTISRGLTKSGTTPN